MACLGFLHTAEAHVATFDELVASRYPAVRTRHVVDRSLLALAVRDGTTPQVREGVGRRVAELGRAGADVVVCTCSTLGPSAETAGLASTVPVIRIDRPMAERAVQIGPRIAVVAALASTVEPTVALIERSAPGGVQVSVELCDDAWATFGRGDLPAYAAQVADAARRVADDVDVVVLAQASMAAAVALLTDLEVPVLASPTSAIHAAVAVCASSGDAGDGARSGPLV